MDMSMPEIENMLRSLARDEADLMGESIALADMNEEGLVEELSLLGLLIDKEKFIQLATLVESAWGLRAYVVKEKLIEIFPYDDEGILLLEILTKLWDLWIPERASIEKIERFIMVGYKLLDVDKSRECCLVWLSMLPRVWDLVSKCDQEDEYDSWDDFYNIFLAWITDVEVELSCEGFDDPYFLKCRIQLCQNYLEQCSDWDDYITERMRGAIGESYFGLGESEKANDFFENWLKEEPSCGWGWIYWSDCYANVVDDSMLDLKRAEEIIRQGLSNKNVSEKKYMQERLIELKQQIEEE